MTSPPSLPAIYRIASTALGKPAGERLAHLEKACGGDPELRAAVESFLAKAESTDSSSLDDFADDHRRGLDRVLDAEAVGPSTGDWCPERIGPFEVRRQLGRGGMGMVFEAVQDKPRRSVALKLMYPGTASAESIRRFHLEGEALGRLQHPGIARVYATETADVGFGEQPYLAMELIEGRPCLEYAHARGLDDHSRVLLLARLCDAVQHAHERGIVHRDIKPDNVLVDGTGQPKLLDFGVARVVEDSTLWSSQQTEHGKLLGTMAYMAPEQVRGESAEVGPPADIYALGVLGFELLTAELPRDIAGLGVTQAIERLLGTEPKRLREVRPSAHRELEVIFGKALSSRPKNRYASAAAMAADLRSHIAHRAISARAPSGLERAAKFVRRHRTLVAATSAVLVALAVGVVGVTMKAIDLRRAKSLANDNAYRARMLTAMNAVMSGGGAEDAKVMAASHPRAETPDRLRGWEWTYAQSFLLNKPLILAEDLQPLGAAWSPDGKTVAVAGDHKLAIYSAADGRELIRWDSEAEGLMLAVAWNPAGDRVAVTGTGIAAVYDTDAGEAVWVRTDEQLQAPTWDLDGTGFWAAHFKTHGLFHFSASTGELLDESDGPPTDWGLTFDPVTGDCVRPGLDGFLRVAPDPRAEGSVLGSHQEVLTAVAWKPDGSTVASAAWDRQIRVWDVKDRRLIHAEKGVGHATMCLEWHPSDDYLLSAGQDGVVRVWLAALDEGIDAYRFQEHLAFEDHPFHVTAAGWSPDGTKILSAVAYTDVRIWNLRARLPRRSFLLSRTEDERSRQSLAWAPDSRRLLVRAGGLAELWDTDKMAPLASRGLAGEVMSPDGGQVAHVTAEVVQIASAATMEVVLTLPLPLPSGRPAEECDAACAWRPNGELYVVHDSGIWRVVGPALEKVGEGLPGLKVIAWTPDGAEMIVSSGYQVFRVDPDTGAQLATYVHSRTTVPKELHVHPTKPLLAIADDRDGVDIVSLERMERVGVIESRMVASVQWSPDGRRLATASNGGSVRLWDAETYQLRASFPCGAEMRAVRWSPNGRVLAALGLDHRVHLWDASLGYDAHGPPR